MTQSEVARKYGLTRQAVSKAVKLGRLPCVNGQISEYDAGLIFGWGNCRLPHINSRANSNYSNSIRLDN